METFAIIALVALGLCNVWDLVDSDAVELRYNSPVRALLAVTAAICSMVVVLLVVGASSAVIVGVILGILLLGAIKALADA